MRVEKIGEDRDGLVLEPGIGVEKHHLVGRSRARGEFFQHQVVAAPEAVVDVLEMQGHAPVPAMLGVGRCEAGGVISRRGVVDEMHLDRPAAMVAPEHALHRLEREIGGAVVDDDDRDLGRVGPMREDVLIHARFDLARW